MCLRKILNSIDFPFVPVAPHIHFSQFEDSELLILFVFRLNCYFYVLNTIRISKTYTIPDIQLVILRNLCHKCIDLTRYRLINCSIFDCSHLLFQSTIYLRIMELEDKKETINKNRNDLTLSLSYDL